jgi:hypothetical protein
MTTKEWIIQEINKLPESRLQEVYQYLKQLSSESKASQSFSFEKAREATKDFKGSLSDAIIEERRNE